MPEMYMAELAEIREQVQNVARDQAKMSEQINGALKRIDEQKQLTESVHTLALSVRDLTNAQKSTNEAVLSLRKDVDELKEKPAKRWDSIVGIVLSAVVGGAITYLLVRVGLQ